jgi:hypothetical protein
MAMGYYLGIQGDKFGKTFMFLMVYVDDIINIIC